MTMVKIVSPSGWDFDGPLTRLVKVSHDGLRGHDRKEFLKTASHVFLPFIDNIKIASGEVPVHALALGAEEGYGMNRNGDGFSEQTCRDYHHTFEKYARAYRNHKNKPHEGHPHYGTIKKAAYNDTMRRVELLVAYNGTKEAAERNGGLVADKELEKLASGVDLPGSMACSVPFDECNWCHNKARTRDDYCTATMCKAGGCKDNLTRLIKLGNDVHQLGVMNPHPRWFDWSLVYRPADRTAYGNKADWLVKAAEDGFFGIGGAKTAEDLGVMAPLAVLMDQPGWQPLDFHTAIDEQVQLAYGLALLERRPSLWPSEQYKRAFDARMQPTVTVNELGEPGTKKCAEALAALAEQKIILPLRDVATLAKQAELAPAAQQVLSGVYGRMLADGSLEKRLASNPLALATKTAAYKTRQWAARLASSLSLEKSAVDRRCRLSMVRDHELLKTGIEFTKTASANEAAEELARTYACYRLAALQRIASFDDEFPLTCCLSLCQN